MGRLFQSEPIMVIAGSIGVLLPAIFELLAAFDRPLNSRQIMAVTSLITVVAGVYARSRVSPVRPT